MPIPQKVKLYPIKNLYYIYIPVVISLLSFLSSYYLGDKLEKVKGSIELRDVRFHYPTRTEAQVFNGFNLRVKAGKVVALVGPSGSGKSSVVSLLERFYDPQEGQVLIDGVDIKTLNVKFLRQQV